VSSSLAKGSRCRRINNFFVEGRRRGWLAASSVAPRRVAAFDSLDAIGSLRCVLMPLLCCALNPQYWSVCGPLAFARDAFASCIRWLTSFAWFVYQLSYRADGRVAVAVVRGGDGTAREAASLLLHSRPRPRRLRAPRVIAALDVVSPRPSVFVFLTIAARVCVWRGLLYCIRPPATPPPSPPVALHGASTGVGGGL
jgi:hypothetical protein